MRFTGDNSLSGIEVRVTRFEIFRRLHHAPPVLRLPTCWDPLSARIYEVAGFPAIGTSSAAVANALGTQDGDCIDLGDHLAAIKRITAVVTVPVSVDFESGYATNADQLARNVGRLAATGAAGYNLEDSRSQAELYSLDEQCARIRAAKAAAPLLFLNARTNMMLEDAGDPQARLMQIKERLAAYLGAGADGIFVPGTSDAEFIADLAATFRKRPLNVQAGPATPPITELERLGVARVSLGSWPMRRAMSVVREIAREFARDGRFDTMHETIPSDEINALFAAR